MAAIVFVLVYSSQEKGSARLVVAWNHQELDEAPDFQLSYKAIFGYEFWEVAAHHAKHKPLPVTVDASRRHSAA